MIEPAATKKPGVLIVDDDLPMRETLAESLQMQGYDVVVAGDAESGLAELSHRTFALVVSDVRMPGMDGVELATHIHRLQAGLPVILMTGFAHEDLLSKAIASGVFTIFHKPFSMEAFSRTVARASFRPAVLVVDDDKLYADSLAASLAAAGLRVEVAYDGDTARERIARGGIDICVLDLVLPLGGGMALLEELRRNPTGVGLIGITGTSDERHIVRAAKLGVSSCLRKPFKVPALLHWIVQVRREAA
jgi:two-component system response regulator HydG